MIGIRFKNYFLIFFAIVSLLVFFLIKPLVQIVLITGVVSYIFYPVYKSINKRLRNDSLSAIIVILLIMFILGSITTFAVLSLISHRGVFYHLAHTLLEEDLLTKYLQGVMSKPELNSYVQEWAKQATSYLIKFVSGVVLSIPKFLFAFILMLFLLYYAFKDGKRFVKELESFIPLKGSHKRNMIKMVDDTLHAIIYGTIMVAFVQGVAATIGFYAFGVRAPVLLGLLTFLTSMIPFLGAAIVWAPIGSIMVIWAYMTNQSLLPGIGVLLYGSFVISLIDNILKPKLIGDRAEIHPVFVVLGIVGGTFMFGFIGLFIGPIILALFKTLLDIYQKEGLRWS